MMNHESHHSSSFIIINGMGDGPEEE